MHKKLNYSYYIVDNEMLSALLRIDELNEWVLRSIESRFKEKT